MEIISPVLSISVDYISMVHFDDTVVIEAQLVRYDGVKMELEYFMYDKAMGDIRIYPELDMKFFDHKEST